MTKTIWFCLYVTIQSCCVLKGIASVLQADPWGFLMVGIGGAGILHGLTSRKTPLHYLPHQQQIIVETK